MDGPALRTLLDEDPLVSDGGMGTALFDAGIPLDTCVEALVLDAPDVVESIHRGFAEAGARMILTNTFGANRYRLGGHGESARLAPINAAGVERARAAGAEVVAGSMGPLGVRLAPYGRVSAADAAAAYEEQARALAEAGADLLVVETQSDLREMEAALEAARSGAPGLAIVVSATFTRDDRTLLGSSPAQVASRLAELGADGIGVNCGEGPAQALRVIRAMRPLVGDVPLAARPNAGGPAEVGGRFVYPATPDYVGKVASALLGEGVRVVGGCCGTGPAHTAAIAAAARPTNVVPRIAVADAERVHEPASTRGDAAPTELERTLSTPGFVIAVEMEPPRSYDTSRLVAAAETLRDAGADVIDVADSPMAKMRMSAWAACRAVQEQAEIETTLHFPTRGRNLLRLQGDLLGAHALAIRNVFVCVGDPVSIGDHPQALNDVDVTATGLLALITEELNEGRDRSGASIGAPTSFFVGAAISPNAQDPEREARLLVRKVRSGARFLLSQPVYDLGALDRLRSAYRRQAGEELAVPILVGILTLVTARHAEFLHNEVPGILVPDDIRARMRGARNDAWREGLSIADELVAGLRDVGAAGVYVMPQFGRYDLAAEVVEAARRQAPRPGRR